MLNRRRPGFSLAEMVIVLVLTGIFTALVIGRREGSPAEEVDAAARSFQRAAQAARSEAVLRIGEARIEVDAAAGRFLAVATTDSAGDATDGRSWTTLPPGAQFGAGAARVGPLGDTITTAVPLTSLRCGSTGDCDMGGRPVVTFYFTSRSRPDAVRAVTVSRTGQMVRYRYIPDTGGWK